MSSKQEGDIMALPQIEVVATRTLLLDGRPTVSIRVGRPRQGRNDAGCEFEIMGLAKPIRSIAFGVDTVQAIEEAIRGAGLRLVYTEEYKTGRLSWDADPNSLGLRVPSIQPWGKYRNRAGLLRTLKPKRHRTKKR
jgi:hypothetical protein